jgi:hypothetical protein
MEHPGTQLNRFERVLFRTALVLGGLLIAARLAAMLFVWYASAPR